MLNSFKFMRAPSTHVHIFTKYTGMHSEANQYIQPDTCYTLTLIYRFAGGGLCRVAFSSRGSYEKPP